MKIAIEGMDGVGKSTISKLIAEKNHMIYLEKPLTEIFELKNIEGKKVLAEVSSNIYNLDNEIIKAWFFGMGNVYSFLKYKDCDLVIDRHFASNYFWNGTKRTDPIFRNMIELIGKPDITILLYASVKTRLERLYKRNPNDDDLNDPEKHILGYDKMISFLNDFEIPYVIVNTEGKTLEEVFNEVNGIVQSTKKKYYQKKLVK